MTDQIKRAWQVLRNFDVGYSDREVQRAAYLVFADSLHALRFPSAVYKPALTLDGTMWCALLGENLQEGVAGFGETPELAMADFDKAWRTCTAVPAAKVTKA